jgi:hypothetical protein
MLKNDTELYNAYGWLASNFSKWTHFQNSTTTGLLSCFENIIGPYDPVKAAPYENWVIANRVEVIDLFNLARD